MKSEDLRKLSISQVESVFNEAQQTVAAAKYGMAPGFADLLIRTGLKGLRVSQLRALKSMLKDFNAHTGSWK